MQATASPVRSALLAHNLLPAPPTILRHTGVCAPRRVYSPGRWPGTNPTPHRLAFHCRRRPMPRRRASPAICVRDYRALALPIARHLCSRSGIVTALRGLASAITTFERSYGRDRPARGHLDGAHGPPSRCACSCSDETYTRRLDPGWSRLWRPTRLPVSAVGCSKLCVHRRPCGAPSIQLTANSGYHAHAARGGPRGRSATVEMHQRSPPNRSAHAPA